jgi:hypothetical protein
MTKFDPTSLDQDYWEKIDREAPISAITKCEEAAKQLITLISLITTIYVGIISFSDLIKQPLSLRPILIFILLPLPFWVISLIFATKVIVPKVYPVDQIQEDYIRISRVKFYYLRLSYKLLIISMISVLVVLAIYLLTVPPPPS